MRGEKRFIATGGYYGPGKVHRYLYDSLNKAWHVGCRRTGIAQPYGEETTNSGVEITCKNVGCR